MKDVFVVGDHIISPLGIGSQVNVEQITAGNTAIRRVDDQQLCAHPFFAALIDDSQWDGEIENTQRYTRLEKLFILSLQALIDQYRIPLDRRTLVLLSTTKGNVSLLHSPMGRTFPKERVHLAVMADEIQRYFGLENRIITISNACISGSLAISVARQLLQGNDYERALVVGGDEISKFIVSGFDAFQALADEPCRPFDRDRNGLNLGEAIAAMYLSKSPTDGAINVSGTSSYNDANHISGPSRTGEGLYQSIRAALIEAGEPTVDFISAHGTATPYNDEMEAIALQRCKLSDIPLHSLKGYYGHTLGASGLLETILGIHALKNNLLIPSIGFEHQGTTQRLNIIKKNTPQLLNTFLKTASGFGGCNIASVFKKI
ncbi:beta-ketoacyl-[acyl-carrier-protein] synthase family protein [Parapedobacter tibetensis]|uniref:beta-ketoacyl-[acyl-carrier-protein] synthase family protein n=1 Tax=Parapedobacter tibetensis TaxID=2972951 RepID=UPI00214D8B19|nr:beta-ketoacyl synthase N-terminal-like domain-containing protein [Parapedobacter tibetensis]